ncbi:hypothetical protein ACQEVG_37895 [Streptomyces sp. CA-135486]|uniref:hypothetical protein n=1 Tax=Streptomyces sp. CA-135486 TaxID=3240049 RepID=UPI003D8E237C
MPSFRTGAVRLWDSGTRWAEIGPQRGEFDWSVLDRLVSGAEQAGLPALFVMRGTPQWARPNGPVGPYADDSRAAPPDRLADWDTFVSALVHRCRGRIEAYDLWAPANDPRLFNGGVKTLVEMTRRASRTIRAADPKATVVCPGMGCLWEPDGLQVLQRFAELGGYRYCDAAGIKLSLSRDIAQQIHGRGLEAVRGALGKPAWAGIRSSPIAFTRGRKLNMLGQTESDTAELFFDNVRAGHLRVRGAAVNHLPLWPRHGSDHRLRPCRLRPAACAARSSRAG